jgi:hypothetical protein
MRKYRDFTDDKDKMKDFYSLSKEAFLTSYSYLTSLEYDLTVKKAKLMKNKLEIWQKKEKNRADSFWYNGIIAQIGNYLLIATGDISISFPDCPDELYKDSRAVEEAENKKYKDKDLVKLEWHNNNWFEVIYGTYDKRNNRYAILDCVMCDVAHDYDAGIQMLKRYVKEKVYTK